MTALLGQPADVGGAAPRVPGVAWLAEGSAASGASVPPPSSVVLPVPAWPVPNPARPRVVLPVQLPSSRPSVPELPVAAPPNPPRGSAVGRPVSTPPRPQAVSAGEVIDLVDD